MDSILAIVACPPDPVCSSPGKPWGATLVRTFAAVNIFSIQVEPGRAETGHPHRPGDGGEGLGVKLGGTGVMKGEHHTGASVMRRPDATATARVRSVQ